MSEKEFLTTSIQAAFLKLPDIISEKQLAKNLNELSPETLRVWRYHRTHKKSGNYGPRFIRLGRSIRYIKADVIEWLIEQTLQNNKKQIQKNMEVA